MTTIFVINEYDETIGFFSTRELAEAALELRVRQEAARGYYGKDNLNPELSWQGGRLGWVRTLGAMKSSPSGVTQWWSVSEEICEVKLDAVPWKSEE